MIAMGINIKEKLTMAYTSETKALSTPLLLLMAVAIFGVVMFEIYSGHLEAALKSVALDDANRALIASRMPELAGLQTPPALAADLAAQLRSAVDDSFIAGFRAVALIAAAIALLGAVVAALTIPPRAKKQ